MLKADSIWYEGLNSLRAGSLGEGPVVWTRDETQRAGPRPPILSGSTSPRDRSSPVCTTIVDWSVAPSSPLRYEATPARACLPACFLLLAIVFPET